MILKTKPYVTKMANVTGALQLNVFMVMLIKPVNKLPNKKLNNPLLLNAFNILESATSGFVTTDSITLYPRSKVEL